MHFSIDIGNTSSKAALFQEEELIPLTIWHNFDSSQLSEIVAKNSISSCIISNVSDSEKSAQYKEELSRLDIESIFELTHELPVPIQNVYDTPETLGMDRLASVVGGSVLFPTKDILVIDAGTCITMDFMRNNKYEGGSISPGLQIKFKALHTFTNKLPLVELEPSTPLIGKSTQTSIQSGVLNGTIAEINHAIAEYKGISDNLAVILCGGDSSSLSKGLRNIDCIEQELVLIGLNEILKHNVQQQK